MRRCVIAPFPLPRPIACRLTGLVRNVEPADPTERPSSFTLATAEGRVEIRLDGGRDYDIRLREHQRTAAPVDVLVETQEGTLMALSIEEP